MISPETLQTLRLAYSIIGYETVVAVCDELEAGRARIADLEKYLEQAQFREIELREQLRAQGLSQEEQAACRFGAASLRGDLANMKRIMGSDDYKERSAWKQVATHEAILRRLGGQTT